MESENFSWLNKDFMQGVLRNHEKDDSIKVTNLTSQSAVAKGDNYGSVMIRSKVEYRRGGSSKESLVEKKSLVIKITPEADGPQKELIVSSDIFGTEIKMMTLTLKKMNELLKNDNCRLSANVLFTKMKNPSLLVIEDLSPLGYRMAKLEAGLDLEHAILAMRNIAKFHASSVALWEKEPSAVESYIGGMYGEYYPEDWMMLFKNGMRRFAHAIRKWSELGPDAEIYSEKFLQVAEIFYELAREQMKPKSGHFTVLNHGDCWANNMLFRYDEAGKPIDHIFVDFQLSIWSSPALDILHFLTVSTNLYVDSNYRETLINEYWSTLTSTMEKLHCETKAPTLEELKKILEDNYIFSIAPICLPLPIILMDKKDPLTDYDAVFWNNSTDENSAADYMYHGHAFRRIMIGRLREWFNQGTIDNLLHSHPKQ